MHAYSKPVAGLSLIGSARFVELFHDYERELVQAGYHHVVARLHLRSIAHFGVWIELEGLDLETIGEGTWRRSSGTGGAVRVRIRRAMVVGVLSHASASSCVICAHAGSLRSQTHRRNPNPSSVDSSNG